MMAMMDLKMILKMKLKKKQQTMEEKADSIIIHDEQNICKRIRLTQKNNPTFIYHKKAKYE